MTACKSLAILAIFCLITLCCNNKSARPDNSYESVRPVDSINFYRDEKGQDRDENNKTDSIFYEKTDNEAVEYTPGKADVYSEYGEEYDAEKERYKQVKNLLIFHTKDTMKLDSTYNATLALGKNISLDELTEKIKKIIEPGGKIKVKDTTQEIGLRMSATLEDKASEKDPNFSIKLVGSTSNIRTYDPKKNKMVWQWNVTPLKEGYHELGLSVAMVDSDGIPVSPETQWYFITIYSERKKASFGSDVGVFIGKNWQWMISAIIIPLFLAWFTTRQRRKNEQNRPPAQVKKPSIRSWRKKS